MKTVRTIRPIPARLFHLNASVRGRVLEKVKRLMGRKPLRFEQGVSGTLDDTRLGRVYLTLEHGLGRVSIIVTPSVYEQYFEDAA